MKKLYHFFRKYHQILGVKFLDFNDWCIAAEIIKNKKHITKEGIDQILKIKSGMNKGRS